MWRISPTASGSPSIHCGEVRFQVERRNGRCSATNVDPATGQRDLDIPGTLRQHFQHKDCGVYLFVIRAGRIQPGDALRVLDATDTAQTQTVTAETLTAETLTAETLTAGAERAEPTGLVSVNPRWMCRACYYVLDQSRPHSRLASSAGAPGTFPLLDWVCPDCGASAEFIQSVPRAMSQH